MNHIESICSRYEEGYRGLLISGRSLYDFVIEDGKLRPLLETLRRALFTRYGMLTVTYSMAAGLDYDTRFLEKDADRRSVENILRAHRLLDLPRDQREVELVIRGISTMVRKQSEDQLKWSDGRSILFAVLIEFTEHLAPALMNGTQTEAQLQVIELSHLTAQSLSLRSSGNLVIFHGREGLIDDLVSSPLHAIRLNQPDQEEKQEFITAALKLYTGAAFEKELTPAAVAHITANTPNRSLEQMLRASHKSGRELTAGQLSAQKNRDVEQISEGTLTSLDTARVKDVVLCGVNIEKAREILLKLGDGLKNGHRTMPANVILAGAPGTGKTDLALLTARQANVPAYQMHSPKGGIVGETERKARLQQTVLKEGAPNVGFIDEITEAMPMERSDFDGDSGASRAVMAELLKSFSDESRRGRSLVIAATNCPWRMSEAMRSRFTFIPVLHPLKKDFAGIVWAIARGIQSNTDITPENALIQEAATVFYNKGANPRHVRAAISNALLAQDALTAELVLEAAHDLCAFNDQASSIYADLWAIMTCSSRSFFPWSKDPKGYPYPPHLKEIINQETGEIDYKALMHSIEEYKNYANV